jgi:hypothetical protein
MVYPMANDKKDMFSRISQLSKSAPLHEASPASSPASNAGAQLKAPAQDEGTPEPDGALTRRKVKAVRRAKNVQIPEDLWDAYDTLKERNITSLLMTPYILEAFREKLARDGAFDKK